MGNSNQNQSFLKKGQGLRILSIKVNSPFDGLVEPFFDFIIDVIPLQPSRSPKQILNQLAGQQIKRQPQKLDFTQMINDNENKKIEFKIVSTKDRNIRSVEVTPNRNWNGSMDLIGIQVRKQKFDEAFDTYLPVTDIAAYSPMHLAGVKAGEYLLGCLEFPYSNLNMFTQGIYDRFFDKQVQDKQINLALYDMLNDQLSIKPILLKRGWGGKGLLGCEFLQGQLYRFPHNWKQRRDQLLKTEKKKIQNQKIRMELGECDGASKTLVEALKNKRNKKGKHMQTIKNMISFPLPQVSVPVPININKQKEAPQQNIDSSLIKEQELKINALQQRVGHLEYTLSNIKMYLDQISQEEEEAEKHQKIQQNSVQQRIVNSQ